nr:MAK10-like protein [Tanacetum cinerariifolium]
MVRENKNPIRTLRDYSKPSHEGYRNTIELPERNNVVLLRSDTILLVQNECSFYGLRSEDPNQHQKDFLKLMDSLGLDVANKARTHLCEIYNGPYDTQYYIENPEQAFVDYASSCANKAGESKAKEEENVRPNAAKDKDHNTTIKANMEFEEESKEEFEEKTEEEAEEEEEDDPEYFDTFPTVKELLYHEWLLKNP